MYVFGVKYKHKYKLSRFGFCTLAVVCGRLGDCFALLEARVTFLPCSLVVISGLRPALGMLLYSI